MIQTSMRIQRTVFCSVFLLGGILSVTAQPLAKLEPVGVEVDSRSEKGKQKEFRVIGQGGSQARIVDKTGKGIVEADPSSPIYDCEVSPDAKRLAIYYLGAASRIMDIESRQTRDLPKKPPGEHKFNFDAWHWLDNDKLISISGDQKLDDHGRPVRHDDNVSRSRLYMYQLSTKALTEISLPKGVDGAVFSIGRINKSGFVQLNIDNKNPETVSSSWFKVRLP